MEDQEDRSIFISLELFLGVSLVRLEEFRAEFDVAGCVREKVVYQ